MKLGSVKQQNKEIRKDGGNRYIPSTGDHRRMFGCLL